jgi:hypothetical protein
MFHVFSCWPAWGYVCRACSSVVSLQSTCQLLDALNLLQQFAVNHQHKAMYVDSCCSHAAALWACCGMQLDISQQSGVEHGPTPQQEVDLASNLPLTHSLLHLLSMLLLLLRLSPTSATW